MSFPGGDIQSSIRSSGEELWLDMYFGDYRRDVVVGTLEGDGTGDDSWLTLHMRRAVAKDEAWRI